MKCKKCGNDKLFYTKSIAFGEVITIVDGQGEYCDNGINSGMYDHIDHKSKSIYYFCYKCHCKVAKIPKKQGIESEGEHENHNS